MRGAPGGEDLQHSVVGSLGSGEESEDSEVDEQGEGGDVEQQVGEPILMDFYLPRNAHLGSSLQGTSPQKYHKIAI